MLVKKNKYLINNQVNFKFKLNVLYLYNTFTVLYFVMPKVYYISKENNKTSLLLTKLSDFKLTLNSFLKMYKNINYFYFFRLKLKGLGFRLNRISDKLCMFFFGAYNFIYMHMDMVMFTRGRNIIILDNDKKLLNIVFYQLLVLKKMDLYSKKKTFYSFDKVKYFKKRI